MIPEILGHEGQLTLLRESLASGRLHHAWLFEGPPGVGKGEVARWLALAATCEATEPSARPCGACPTCLRVLAGVHPDVVWLGPDPEKATSTIPVERVREVLRATSYHRFGARARFVIVDPAEGLAAAGANALLKTLEEPPDGTFFVLVATSARALLPTIASRCQRLRFGPVDRDRLEAWLARRGVPEAAELARLAQGSPGEALRLAEADALTERRALRDAVLGALGGDLADVLDLAATFSGPRATSAPRVEALLALLEELLRDVVVCASGPGRDLVHADLGPRLAAWAASLWPSGVERCRRALVDARADLAVHVLPQVAIEALLTRWATELGEARKKA